MIRLDLRLDVNLATTLLHPRQRFVEQFQRAANAGLTGVVVRTGAEIDLYR